MNPVHRVILAHMRATSSEAKLTAFTDQQLIHRMFSNHRGQRGMRLTQFGLQVMQCYFTAYDVKVPEDEIIAPKHLICLDERAIMPYYMDKTHIVVFDPAFGVKLRLVDGRLSTLMEIEAG
jgi:hypothetical protein